MHNHTTTRHTHTNTFSIRIYYNTFFFGCAGMRCVGRMVAYFCCYTLTLNATMHDERKPLFVRYQYIWIYGYMYVICARLVSTLYPTHKILRICKLKNFQLKSSHTEWLLLQFVVVIVFVRWYILCYTFALPFQLYQIEMFAQRSVEFCSLKRP